MRQHFKSGLVAVALAGALLLFTGGSTIKGPEAHRLVKEGAVLLDVRTPEEFAAGHVEGAVNIPVQELEHRLEKLPKKDQPIVIYCRSGRRSASAQQLLERAGYTKTYDLGAMSNW